MRDVVMTSWRGVSGDSNCTSREVTIPTSLGPKDPVSEDHQTYQSGDQAKQPGNGKQDQICQNKRYPQITGKTCYSEERRLLVKNIHP